MSESKWNPFYTEYFNRRFFLTGMLSFTVLKNIKAHTVKLHWPFRASWMEKTNRFKYLFFKYGSLQVSPSYILVVYIPWSLLPCCLNILKRLIARSPPAPFNNIYTCTKISLELAWEITYLEGSACLKAYLDYLNSNLSFQENLF